MNDFEMPANTPNLYASLTPDDTQWARIECLSATPRCLAELQRELMMLSLIHDGGNPNVEVEDMADIGAAIDALRLMIAVIPAETERDLWIKRCSLANSEPHLAINGHLPLLSAASLRADAKRLYGCKTPSWARKCAVA